jgi:hypothetical protein
VRSGIWLRKDRARAWACQAHGGTGPIDKTAVRKIYKQYSERFPQLSAEDRIIALMATYCRDAANALPNRTSVIRQQLEFTDALVAADFGAKKTEDGSKP